MAMEPDLPRKRPTDTPAEPRPSSDFSAQNEFPSGSARPTPQASTAPVPLHPHPIRLRQTTPRGRPADRHGDPQTGRSHRNQRTDPAAHRLHPCAMRHVPGNREALGPGRRRRIRLLRLPLPLLLGMRLYLVTTIEGMPVTWCLAHPKLDERDVMAALLEVDHHLITTGQIILAEKGFAGTDFEKLLREDLGVHLVRPQRRQTRRPTQPGRKSLLRMRQWIEAIIDTLKGQLSLEQHGARQRHGIYARVGQRLLAMAACIWRNTNTGTPSKRSPSPTTTENGKLTVHLQQAATLLLCQQSRSALSLRSSLW